jgi:PAS domain S-box-containing protein
MKKKVTHQKNTESRWSETDLERLIRTANAPIFGVDVLGNVNEWNDKVSQLTGYSKEEVLGQNLVETLITENFKSSVNSVIDQALQGEEQSNYESPIRTKTGETIQLLINSTSRRSDQGDIIGVVGIAQDITKRLEAESNLRSEQGSLKLLVKDKVDELRCTHNKVEQARLQAETGNSAKTVFLSTISHELRTPLNAILGFTDILIGEFFGELNEKQKDFLNQIMESGRLLLSLITDLLNFTTADSADFNLNPEPIDLESFFKDVLGSMSSQFDLKRIERQLIQKSAPKHIIADRQKLKQIVLNLVSNAIKYTRDGGFVKVILEQKGEDLKVQIKDTGIGIERSELSKIFIEFHQADAVRDQHLGGTGIGLSLTRKFVEIQGGYIGVESEVDKGTCVWFTLPL